MSAGNGLHSKRLSTLEGFWIGDVCPIAGDKGEKLIEGGPEQGFVAVLFDIAQVWRAHNVVHMQMWMVRGRLARVYVDRCIPWTPSAERLFQGTRFNQSCSTSVDEQGGRLHLRQVSCRNNAARLLRQCEMQAQHIGIPKQCILAGGNLDAVGLGAGT